MDLDDRRAEYGCFPFTSAVAARRVVPEFFFSFSLLFCVLTVGGVMSRGTRDENSAHRTTQTPVHVFD